MISGSGCRLVVPQGVTARVVGGVFFVTGQLGELTLPLVCAVTVTVEDAAVVICPAESTRQARAMLGTVRMLVSNMMIGVVKGFAKKMLLVGTGYRAQVQGSVLTLLLGFSHPVIVEMPVGIRVESAVQSEILLKGIDKHLVGLVAANIRRFRPPDPYKGRGLRYADEVIVLKEVKKK